MNRLPLPPILRPEHFESHNEYLIAIEKVRSEMDESGMGEEVSTDETIAFWIVVVVALACLGVFFYGLMQLAGVV